MSNPKYKVGDKAYVIYNYEINEIVVGKIEGDKDGWTYQDATRQRANYRGTESRMYATKKDAETGRLKLIDAEVERYRKELLKDEEEM